MPTDIDGPADERCESCHRLDPAACPCIPETVDDDVLVEDVLLPLATSRTALALTDVADERVRQVEKWGVQSWPDASGDSWDGRMAHDAAAERADFWKAENDRREAAGTVAWDGILLEEVYEALSETDPARLREELVQVAAVALSWVEDIDWKGTARFRELAARPSPFADAVLRSPGASS